MANRTRIVCLHEGEKGRSIDGVFIRTLIKKLDPPWIRPWNGNNVIRTVDKGGRSQLISSLPQEIRVAQEVGSSTKIMVWADLDHDMPDEEALKREFWNVCKKQNIASEEFEEVIFVFAKDRLENWVEFLNSGTTSEAQEAPRLRNPKEAAIVAEKLAVLCKGNQRVDSFPESLRWSCKNWRQFVRTLA